MSAVMRVPWENRLAKMIREPGGVKVGDALAKADENLKTIQEDCMKAVDGYLTQIEALHQEAKSAPTAEVKDAIYRLADDIHGMAGVFGLGELGSAAFSLCDLIDRQREGGGWTPAAVEVHLNAFRLLRHPAGDPAARAEVLEGLRRVNERVLR